MNDSTLPLEELQRLLLRWFQQHKRPLPWRLTPSPYRIWISEIMLQQTQMERGVRYFLKWMERFPHLQSLAEAPEELVLKTWEGLGYYSRARNLLQSAKILWEKFHGEFPHSAKELEALPGIGPYTAAAIASTAFGEAVACVDANVIRVITRLYDIARPAHEAMTEIHALATRFLSQNAPGEHNQAMMELGALVCHRNPQCTVCPFSQYCLAKQRGVASERPIQKKKEDRKDIVSVCVVLRYKKKYYIQQRPSTGLWAGMWEFPSLEIKSKEDIESGIQSLLLSLHCKNVQYISKLCSIPYTYTRHHAMLYCFLFDSMTPLQELHSYILVDTKKLLELAMPSAHRKLAQKLSSLLF